VPRRTRIADAAWGTLVLAAIIGLGEYVGARAWALSFTHDESLSYIRYVHLPFSSILLSRGTDANHHPLNTLAMKLADHAFGPSEIALRWSSIIAFVVYAVVTVLLLRRVERKSIRVLGLALAIANPYVLDFFSLARGYAPALALVATGALFTLDFVERPRVSAALAAVTAAALAVLANFATLDFYLAVVLTLALALVVPARTGERSVARGQLAAALVLPTVGVALLAGIPLRRLRSEGELYFGGHDGIWQDTVRGLISSTLYGREWDVLEITIVVLVALTVAGGAVAATIALRNRTLPLHVTAFLLLAVPAIVSIAQHYVFGTLFLIERTALFFVPLFAIWLAYAADALARNGRFTVGVSAAATVIATLAFVNLAFAANLSYVLDWRYDATTERVITELARPPSGPRTVDLGLSYLFQPAAIFYRETRFRWLPDNLSHSLDNRSDYYYVIGPDVATVRARGARIIRVYSLSGGVLARDAHSRR
jgi:hypothetical protein